MAVDSKGGVGQGGLRVLEVEVAPAAPGAGWPHLRSWGTWSVQSLDSGS